MRLNFQSWELLQLNKECTYCKKWFQVEKIRWNVKSPIRKEIKSDSCKKVRRNIVKE